MKPKLDNSSIEVDQTTEHFTSTPHIDLPRKYLSTSFQGNIEWTVLLKAIHPFAADSAACVSHRLGQVRDRVSPSTELSI